MELMRMVSFPGLYTLKLRVVEPMVVNTVSKVTVSVENLSSPLVSAVPMSFLQLNANKKQAASIAMNTAFRSAKILFERVRIITGNPN
jgi:hypothetical protein